MSKKAGKARSLFRWDPFTVEEQVRADLLQNAPENGRITAETRPEMAREALRMALRSVAQHGPVEWAGRPSARRCGSPSPGPKRMPHRHSPAPLPGAAVATV